MTIPAQSLDILSINTIRFLAIDAVEQARSGHPGLPLGAAPMAFVLWDRFLRHNPKNPAWFNRDRFVLSAGHGSMLLYGLLHLTGYALPLEELQRFRQWGSATPGHPERGVTPGVETTTGPLGQGFANAVGMALASAHLAARFNRPDCAPIEHYTYCLAGDGDLMEGVAAEACSLAGHLRLGRLICLYDDNRVSLAASTELSFTEDRGARFAACGWHVESVDDGNDLEAIHRALVAARAETGRPSLVIVRTHIGYGSPHRQDSFEAHGAPLGAEEVRLTKERLGWPLEPAFHIPDEVRDHMGRAAPQGERLEAEWNTLLAEYERAYPEPAAELRRVMAGELPPGWADDIQLFAPDPKGMATRVAGGRVMNAVAPRLPELVGGSADLNPSTHTALSGFGDCESPHLEPADRQGAVGGVWGYAGRNIHFGVREHAMGGILNGMAAHGGVIPFGATFLTFSDYLRPSLRLAALMGLGVIHVFTHDSIALGEDGPTHQPVEQVAALRAIPNLTVIRPADANETAVAWQVALETRDRPTLLVLSRQNLPVLDRDRYAPAEGVRRGGYILAAEEEGLDLILIASGSEVALALAAREVLEAAGVSTRVVSLPSWEMFEAQPPEYRAHVLPPEAEKRLAIEAGSPFGWERYTGATGAVVGVEGFGASAPGPEVMRAYGFTVENVCRRARALLGRDDG
jgi:transketolase